MVTHCQSPRRLVSECADLLPLPLTSTIFEKIIATFPEQRQRTSNNSLICMDTYYITTGSPHIIKIYFCKIQLTSPKIT